ncbi:MAG: hypothetical protein QGF59_05995, partial [Pirellulaceae bacterium]|nr:hypothetical protein [Pirellulaceae bacterium]
DETLLITGAIQSSGDPEIPFLQQLRDGFRVLLNCWQSGFPFVAAVADDQRDTVIRESGIRKKECHETAPNWCSGFRQKSRQQNNGNSGESQYSKY